DKADGEAHIKIDSDTLPFDTRPWMKSAEIADAVLENLDHYKFIRVNFPGGDMVGHFAELEPTISAMEAIDIALARIAKKVDELGGLMLITADHGNAEELLDQNGEPKTSHSINKVPCIFYDNTKNRDLYTADNSVARPGLSNVAATIAFLLGYKDLPTSWRPSLIKPKSSTPGVWR
ncbi:alkaline phosphatase family protein, partial [Candidatus Saccharibacteria bacterium]|nr:alkaline phosphatase family protein [Candidatus Saccharibacteria bacterium]